MKTLTEEIREFSQRTCHLSPQEQEHERLHFLMDHMNRLSHPSFDAELAEARKEFGFDPITA